MNVHDNIIYLSICSSFFCINNGCKINAVTQEDTILEIEGHAEVPRTPVKNMY
jgi:hypothetical protein